jgi:PBSX family phage portal protein
MPDRSESNGASNERRLSKLEEVGRTVREIAAGITTPVVKALLVGGEGGGSRQIDPDNEEAFFRQHETIDAPYDPEMLGLLFEHSNSLRQNVDAYATNIDGFGYRLEPRFVLSDEKTEARLTAMLTLAGQPADAAAVKALREQIETEMEIEKVRLEHFFEFCSPDLSFVTLRRRMRQDVESLGNGYWEVLRSGDGEVSAFVYVPGHTVRLQKLDPEPVEVSDRVLSVDLKWREAARLKLFRRYVQKVGTRAVFFKEFGDPRAISSSTGKAIQEGSQDRQATELIHFEVHSSRSAYGVPRWIGNLLSVLGSRQSEEVNYLYFENKSIPPLAVLVSGGRLGADSVTRLKDYVETHIKGKRNFHNILLIEAEPIVGAAGTATDTSARMKIEIKPLTGSQQSDALFQNYDERNIDKVGMSFRLPRLLRGDIRDFNRSTADAAIAFTEMQVFGPERDEFDFTMNRLIFPALSAKYWKFRSLSPVTRDPAAMAEVIKNLANAGVLTPKEGRDFASDVFNRELPKIEAPWVNQPLQLTLAGIDMSGGGIAGPVSGSAPVPSVGQNPTAKLRGPIRQVAEHLLKLRGELAQAEHAEAGENFRRGREEDNQIVIQMTAEEFSKLGIVRDG